ncbi:SDR family NAD(P)-dependent oxidoreductase, partial [Streptomyces oceani]
MTVPERSRARENRASDAVAVVGLSCRLPHAADPESFWRLLRAGEHAITEVPADRWDAEAVPSARRGGFVDRVDGFDPGFFGIAPVEAAAMDPQQRLALELAWEALEHAGVVPAELRHSRTGVYLGAISDEYAALDRGRGLEAIDRHSMTGGQRAMIANRVSYFLGFRGPSFTVDAAQSSSLVSVHLACESLRAGEADTALAGGVSLALAPQSAAAAERFGGLSPDGRCYTFDARANGYVRGEGGGVVVLKRLRQAVADGDRVLGVIRGSAVNNDGGGPGLTAPSQAGQEEVLRLAYEDAAVDPAAVRYVELHGTGTAVGDPTEAAALGAVLGTAREEGSVPLAVGSAKTNVGHAEGAAGVVGLLKVLLALRHRELPASLNYEHPNPRIPLDRLRLRVQDALSAWPGADGPLLAGVSSFGMGGTNCHVVLQDYDASAAHPGAEPATDRSPLAPRRATTAPPHPAESTDPGISDPACASSEAGELPVPWVLSGRDAAALRDQARRLHAFRTGEPAPAGGPGPVEATERPVARAVDIGHTLAHERTSFAHRAVLLGTESERMAGLTALIREDAAASLVRGTASRTTHPEPVFVFPGQGSQWVGMGRELWESEPVFAACMDECAGALAPHVDWSLWEVLGDEAALARVDVVQPALWAVMVSLAELWRSYGVRPAAVVGHSQGEIAAAHVAGALSLDDAALVVARRSASLVELSGLGGMVSVALPAPEASELLSGRDELSLASINGPASVVVSGPQPRLADLVADCAREDVRTRWIAVDYASHSPQVERVRERLLADLADIRPRAGSVPFHSTVTGEPIDTATLDAEYWYRNLRQTVLFEPVVRPLLACHALLEVSPHPVLTAGVRDAADAEGLDTPVIGTLRRAEVDHRRMLASVAEAHVRGVRVDWSAALPDGRSVELPTYPFQRQRYWLDGLDAGAGAQRRVDAPGRTAHPAGTSADSPRPSGPAADPTSSAPERPAGMLPDPLWTVRSHAAVLLGHSDPQDVDPELPFRELGFDSVSGLDLRNRLAGTTGLRLSNTLLFDHPTPAALARYLREATADERPLPADDATGTARAQDGARDRTQDDEPIAVIGMSCRLPGGVTSPEELWSLLEEGRDAISDFPTDREWDLSALSDAVPRRGGFLDDVADFDAGLFGVSPREALAMDPQQRVLLEAAWEVFERAGIDPTSLRGTATGVFAGAMTQEYGPRLHDPDNASEGYLLTGTTASVLSGRLAYTFGFEGPAMTVDTACSSSLVALHLAMRSLRAGECSMALAGGVAVLTSPGIFAEFSRQGGLSPDGRCKAFGAEADGTGWAEGVGVLLLARLSDAVRDGHRVLAVVRGSAVNSDGASNGLTAPNGPAQQRVIRQALADAGLRPYEVDAVEAHGTGTTLGDPIEAEALLATYGQQRERPVLLGSLKSNLGHTQAAAGIAGVIKMVLAMRHATLPRTLHADTPSAHVAWDTGALTLLTEAGDWPATGRPRRAGVSSFGISGTNAHVVLEQAPTSRQEPGPEEEAPGPLPVVLSARNHAGLREQARQLRVWAAEGHGSLADLAFSRATGRSTLEQRAAVIAEDLPELLVGLDALASGVPQPGLPLGEAGAGDASVGPVFVFPGQGSQWVGMGRELWESEPVFAACMDECAGALAPHVDWSLWEVLGDEAALARVDVVQPALWAVMVSLAELWRSYGVRPAAVVGHSQGEIAAAHVAGALSLEDAALVVALRSRALLALSGQGGMVSVPLPLERVREHPLVREPGAGLSVAAVNGPASVVVSGDPDALDTLLADYTAQDVRARRVPVDYASHSAHVERISERLHADLAAVTPGPASVPVVSTVTGTALDTTGLDAGYWYRNLRETVRLDQAVDALRAAGRHIFLEVSPHPVLTMALQETAPELVVLSSLRRDGGGQRRFATALAEAYVHGVRPDWRAVLPGARSVDLPTYPFQRERYWLPTPTSAMAPSLREAGRSRDTGRDHASSAGPGEEPLDSWGYRVNWEPLPPESEARQDAALDGTWLLLGSDPERLAPAARALEGRGAEVRGVVLREADRESLGAELAASERAVSDGLSGILSLLALDDRPAAATLALVQAHGDTASDAPLWCVTDGAVAAAPDDPAPDPAQAMVWGLGRVAALERPGGWGGLLDLSGETDWDHLAGFLALATPDEDQVAVRSAGCLGRRLVRREPTRSTRAWRPAGTVLITGGTGTLGGHLARDLAREGAEHLVLASRRGPDADGAEALRAELTGLGADVTLVACDMADREAVAELLAAHPPHAVVHAAGVLDEAPIGELTEERLRAVIGAKAEAAGHLDELTARLDLSAFVLISSGSGVWGSTGHGAYAAANAALDALAERRRAAGLPATAVAWGAWADTAMGGERWSDLGLAAMPTPAAVRALRQALDRDETAVVVADVDWSRFLPAFSSARPSPLLAGLRHSRGQRHPDVPGAAGPFADWLTGLPQGERAGGVIEFVRGHAAAVLGHRAPDAVAPGKAFRDQGFDSLTSVDLRNALVGATGLGLPATLLFDHPSPTALAEHLVDLVLGSAVNAAEPEPPTVDTSPTDDDPIVIVSMSCRFPGDVRSPEDLWRLLLEGGDAISDFPTDRGWDLEALYDPDGKRPGSTYATQGGFLRDVGGFDAGFFGISPREALAMDPQQRLLLEVSWEAFERAGIDPAGLRGSDTGVFVGAMDQDYGPSLHEAPADLGGYLLTGNTGSVVSGRLSYTYGFSGPAVTVDTGCSSSLVALHQGVGALRAGECGLALVGGVTVMSTPGAFVEFSRQGGLAGDGRCKAFGSGADGT